MKGNHPQHLELVIQQLVCEQSAVIPPTHGNRSSLVQLHESAERSAATWREKSRGKKRGRKAVPSHPQARREGNGKLLLTHFI